jgi:hypothetical protein
LVLCTQAQVDEGVKTALQASHDNHNHHTALSDNPSRQTWMDESHVSPSFNSSKHLISFGLQLSDCRKPHLPTTNVILATPTSKGIRDTMEEIHLGKDFGFLLSLPFTLTPFILAPLPFSLTFILTHLHSRSPSFSLTFILAHLHSRSPSFSLTFILAHLHSLL